MRKKNSGFTLAELLIVVAIIAILVAVSVPLLTSNLEKARRAADLSNARSIRSVLSTAVSDGVLEFKDTDTCIAVFVSASKTDGGCYDNHNKVYINGNTYGSQGIGAIWEILSGSGIDRTIRMKQKANSISWYGISINGAGESYYYEGYGNAKMDDFRTSTQVKRYSWTEIYGEN